MENPGEYRDEIRQLWQRLIRLTDDEDTEREAFLSELSVNEEIGNK